MCRETGDVMVVNLYKGRPHMQTKTKQKNIKKPEEISSSSMDVHSPSYINAVIPWHSKMYLVAHTHTQTLK